MKTKFDSDVELPLNKIIELHSKMIVVRAVFHENDKNNPPVYLAMQLILIKRCIERVQYLSLLVFFK